LSTPFGRVFQEGNNASEDAVEGRQHMEIQTDSELEELYYELRETYCCSGAQTEGEYDDTQPSSIAFALITLTEDKQTQAEEECIVITE
jgi:hypothetical protein